MAQKRCTQCGQMYGNYHNCQKRVVDDDSPIPSISSVIDDFQYGGGDCGSSSSNDSSSGGDCGGSSDSGGGGCDSGGGFSGGCD